MKDFTPAPNVVFLQDIFSNCRIFFQQGKILGVTMPLFLFLTRRKIAET